MENAAIDRTAEQDKNKEVFLNEKATTYIVPFLSTNGKGFIAGPDFVFESIFPDQPPTHPHVHRGARLSLFLNLGPLAHEADPAEQPSGPQPRLRPEGSRDRFRTRNELTKPEVVH